MVSGRPTPPPSAEATSLAMRQARSRASETMTWMRPLGG
jgi:hypothetical protein